MAHYYAQEAMESYFVEKNALQDLLKLKRRVCCIDYTLHASKMLYQYSSSFIIYFNPSVFSVPSSFGSTSQRFLSSLNFPSNVSCNN